MGKHDGMIGDRLDKRRFMAGGPVKLLVGLSGIKPVSATQMHSTAAHEAIHTQ